MAQPEDQRRLGHREVEQQAAVARQLAFRVRLLRRSPPFAGTSVVIDSREFGGHPEGHCQCRLIGN